MYTTRIRIKNKFFIKIRIQDSIQRMVHQPVTNRCLMNISWFWVVYFKCAISTVLIRLFRKFFVKRKNIVLKRKRKLTNIFSFSFATKKFLPCYEEIFYRNDIIIRMAESSLSLSLSLSVVTPFFKELKRDICCGLLFLLILQKANATP